jgi:tetratricopeptide (TPR) repeat protein
MRGLVVVILSCLLSAPASAAPRPSHSRNDSSVVREVEHLAAMAVEAYQSGDYERAVALLTSAYAIRPQPLLLYNLAKAYDKMGQEEFAILNYRKYLAADRTDEKLAARAQERMVALQSQIDARTVRNADLANLANDERFKQARAEEERAAAKRAENARRVFRESRRKVLLGAGIAAAIVGVGALAGGVGLWADATSKHDAFAKSRDQLAKQKLRSDAQSLGIGSTVLYAVGGVLAAGGLAAALAGGIIYREKARRDTVSLAPWLELAGASVGGSATWTF